jgi:hypothetical protein
VLVTGDYLPADVTHDVPLRQDWDESCPGVVLGTSQSVARAVAVLLLAGVHTVHCRADQLEATRQAGAEG